MALRTVRRALARWLHRWAESILPEEDREVAPAAASEPMPELFLHGGGGPPAHWIELVRYAAPELLQPAFDPPADSFSGMEEEEEEKEDEEIPAVEARQERTPLRPAAAVPPAAPVPARELPAPALPRARPASPPAPAEPAAPARPRVAIQPLAVRRAPGSAGAPPASVLPPPRRSSAAPEPERRRRGAGAPREPEPPPGSKQLSNKVVPPSPRREEPRIQDTEVRVQAKIPRSRSGPSRGRFEKGSPAPAPRVAVTVAREAPAIPAPPLAAVPPATASTAPAAPARPRFAPRFQEPRHSSGTEPRRSLDDAVPSPPIARASSFRAVESAPRSAPSPVFSTRIETAPAAQPARRREDRRWPALLEPPRDEPADPAAERAAIRSWERQQRLDREQQGV